MTRPLAEVDPLGRARQAAAHALRDRLEAAGYGEWWPHGSALLEAVPILAEVAVNAAYADLKRALRPRTENGR